MDEILYKKSDIVTLVSFEFGYRKLVIAKDVYAAMEIARAYQGLVMSIEVIGFAGNVFELIPELVEM